MSHPLWHVNHERFKFVKPQEESTLVDLCRTHNIDFDNRCMFLELDSLTVDSEEKGGQEVYDVILIDKV